MRRLLAVAVLLLGLVTNGCGGKQVAPHPGSIDMFDSRVYDVLLVFQGALDQAKLEYRAGKLPQSRQVKDTINTAGESYDLLRTTWLAYRDAKMSVPANADKVAATMKTIETLLPHASNFIDQLKRLIANPPVENEQDDEVKPYEQLVFDSRTRAYAFAS